MEILHYQSIKNISVGGHLLGLTFREKMAVRIFKVIRKTYNFTAFFMFIHRTHNH